MKPSIEEQIAFLQSWFDEITPPSADRETIGAILATLSQHKHAMAELEAAKAVMEGEERVHQYTLRLWREAKAARERAMAVVEAARALGEAMNNCQPCDAEFRTLWAALAALDTAETDQSEGAA